MGRSVTDIPSCIEERLRSYDLSIGEMQLLDTQGFMSKVYSLKDKEGKVYVLHIIALREEHRRRDFPRTLKVLGDYFLEIHHSFFPKYYFTQEYDGVLFTLQEYLPGKVVGKRCIREGDIFDEFFYDEKELILPQIQENLATLHATRATGAGYINQFSSNSLSGTFPSWKIYLRDASISWMEKIPLEGSSKDKISLLIDSLPNECNTTLVHSDLINPSNTIIAGTKRLSHIDWEWSLIGDPAWEFADIGWKKVIHNYGLERYFHARGITKNDEKRDFLERAKKYHILWLLWGTSLHASGGNREIYGILQRLLEEELTYI